MYQPNYYHPHSAPQYVRPVVEEGPATAALTWAIVGVFFNLFLVPGILAIVYGSKALDRRYNAGRNKAAWGLGIGIAATVVYGIIALSIIVGAAASA